MSMSYFTLFDLAISGVPVLLFCAWQLVSVNREIARDKQKKADAQGPAPSPDRAGHAVGQHGEDHR